VVESRHRSNSPCIDVSQPSSLVGRTILDAKRVDKRVLVCRLVSPEGEVEKKRSLNDKKANTSSDVCRLEIHKGS
jgi:hypothetical protein